MRLVSFNINGIRARLHQLQALIDTQQPDVIGLQETKVQDSEFPTADVEAMGYHVFLLWPKRALRRCTFMPSTAASGVLRLSR